MADKEKDKLAERISPEDHEEWLKKKEAVNERQADLQEAMAALFRVEARFTLRYKLLTNHEVLVDGSIKRG